MNTDINNRQIQAEAAAAPGTSTEGVANRGKVQEDLWFAKRDRELVEKMKTEGCGGACKGGKDGCDKADCCKKVAAKADGCKGCPGACKR